jgi:tetratricopeptide (TPR) repeat protein
MSDPLIDSVVGQYQVLSRLGGGAMGVVYQARDMKLGRLVALKFLPAEWSHDEDAKQRFVREAQAASSTDHANICTIHDIQTTDDGRLFIVMAHYEGETLKQRLTRGPVPVAEALDIATQVADGLARAHAAGVVHRDIKPGNIVLTADAVKIVDFGLATLAGAVQLTQTGSPTPVGTVVYMAPEVLRGHAATAQSDVWAVGVMLYEMLAGHPPFQGSYAEAISYAIRHETPPPLRAGRPEIPEDVEQLVFRALHKEPDVRFAGGRALARALRQAQGHTVPLELLTGPVTVSRDRTAAPGRRRFPWRAVAATALALAAVGGVAWWYVSRPVQRTFVAIAPVVNGTGDRTLDPYRLGLTYALTRELSESADVRVVPYAQLVQPLRRFLTAGTDVSSPEAIRALTAASGASVIVVPTLLYEKGAWKARADLQQRDGGVIGRVETEAIDSSLTKDAAATLVSALATRVEERFRNQRWTMARVSARPGRFQSLDAAQAFEEGITAYASAEYADARDAFARAAREDPRHPLPVAWQSRVAQVTGDRNGAAEAADRAEARLQGASPGDTLFVQAVVAEARRQDENARQRYEELATSRPDDPSAIAEVAGYQDRSGRTAEAIASYQQVLTFDPAWPTPSLELCRLYNSTRMSDAAQARAFGERAQKAFAAMEWRAGEAQAMLCLADILRVGKPDERAQARALATRALGVFESLGLHYSVARAQHYVASAARAQDDLAAAAEWWEKALASAKGVGNTSLESAVYTNLGVTHTALGNRGRALDFYRQSYEMAERRGDERRAAYSRANAGALLLEYGGQPDEGLRFVEGALRVVRRLGDTNFEVFCLQLIAAHDRFVGRHESARRGIAQALDIARKRNFVDAIPSLLLDDGRVLTQMGDYTGARETFLKALASEGATEVAELLVDLGRVHALIGDVDAAREALDRASRLPEAAAGDVIPRLKAAFGELAYAEGRVKDARDAFDEASRLWTDDLPDAASVESRAFVGLLDGLAGKPGARALVDASLQQARRMQRPALEAEARVFLARLDLHAGQPERAATVLSEAPVEPIGPELRAQIHHWRGAAAAALGTGDRGARDSQEARRLLDAVRDTVPSGLRERFLSRPDRQALLR